MTDWMAYVYMQQAKPTNLIGVPITIDVIDSNNNYRTIGQTTSDANGFFSLNWQPDITGKYTVIATFAGSQSYWPAHSQNAFIVSDVAPTQPPAPTAPASAADMYFIPSIAAIILAIVIVGIVMVLLFLRRRP
jgi:hypothetical protein